jgi:probable HAF family extracellular repeat protein
LGGTKSYAHAINSAGQVVGTAYIAGNASLHAFLYNDGSMRDLGTLGGPSSYAYGVNDQGQVVGTSNVPGPDNAHAFVYRDGAMRDLNELADAAATGWTLSSAHAINASGQIVGFGTFNGQTAGFLLTPTSTAKLNLPTLEGAEVAGIAAR